MSRAYFLLQHPPLRCALAGLLLVWLLAGLAMPAQAQTSRQSLEKERKVNLAKIKEAESILKQTATQKKNTIGQLSAINRQIEVRQDLIRSISREIKILEEEIAELNAVVTALNDDLEGLKAEYASMLLNTQRKNTSTNRLSYLFTATSFNQFLLRVKYLEQYSKARQNQARQISWLSDHLSKQSQEQELKKSEQKQLLSDKIDENKNLLALKGKQNKIIKNLSSREKELKKELADRKKANEKLDKVIADLVRKELERNRNTDPNSSIAIDLTQVSERFEKSRTRLDWPVTSGFISSRFGKQPHPVLKGIQIENRGVDIQTNKNEKVRSVYDGVVASVAFVPGMNNVVLLKHGQYFTLYARLKNVSVKKGQQVAANETLGEVYTDADGISELQFQVWRNSQKLDPQKWLVSK